MSGLLILAQLFIGTPDPRAKAWENLQQAQRQYQEVKK